MWRSGPSTGQAAVLGLLHGPAELLPVSSSAHITLVARLLGWPLPPDGAQRKTFEVALHGGTLLGLLVLVPWPAPRQALLSTLPAAVAGLLLERPVERRLGGVRATAAGLVAGSALLVAADARGPGGVPAGGAARHDPGRATGAGRQAGRAGRAGRDDPGRAAQDATDADALVLGAAQALALVPGLSRLGMAVAAARLRGFSRPAAFALGRAAGLPVVAGATGLKGLRLLGGGASRPLVAGAAGALAGTLAAAPLARSTAVRRAAAERVLLAAAALWEDGRR